MDTQKQHMLNSTDKNWYLKKCRKKASNQSGRSELWTKPPPPRDGEGEHFLMLHSMKGTPSDGHLGGPGTGKCCSGVCAKTPCFQLVAQSLTISPKHKGGYI